MIEATTVLAFLATYAVHSTLLLGGAWVARKYVRNEEWRETMWKAALLGGVLTAFAQTAGGMQPIGGAWAMVRPAETASSALDERAAAIDGTATPRAAEEEGMVARERTVTLEAAEPGVSAPAPAEPIVAPPTRTTPGALAMVLFVWAALAFAMLVKHLLAHIRLYRVIRSRVEVTDARTVSILAELRWDAGVRRPVRLTSSAVYPSPFAIGTAEICVPERLIHELDDEQKRSVLAHELGHLVRRDPVWQVVAMTIQAVFFFQPLNRVARRQLRDIAENLADDWAVQHTGSPLGLARSLADIATWARSAPQAVPAGTFAMADSGSRLMLRVERLLARTGSERQPILRWRVAAVALGLLSVAGAAPAITARTLPPLPVHSDQDGTQESEVIAHPDPSADLRSKLEWVAAESRRRNIGEPWIAYAIERPLPGNTSIIGDSRGFNVSRWGGEPIGRMLFGNGYRAPDETPQEISQPIILLFHMNGRSMEQLAFRTANVPASFRGAPVFWLGGAENEESIAWLSSEYNTQPIEVRDELVEMIALHDDAPRVIPFLRSVIGSDVAENVRSDAVEGLSWQPTPEAVQLLTTVVRGQGPERLRAEAAETLGEIGTQDGAAALVDLAATNLPSNVRGELVEAMSEYAQDDVLRALTAIVFDDADRSVQMEAVETIGEFPPDQALPVLQRIVRTHPDRDVRAEAIDVIGQMDSAAAVDILESLIRPDNPVEVRMEAVEAMGDREDADWAPVLADIAFNDADASVRIEAIETIVDGASPEQARALLRRVVWEHPDVDARIEAVESLENLPAAMAMEELDRIIAEHTEEALVIEAVETLGDVGGSDAADRLTSIARTHRSAAVRREAVETLADVVNE